MTNITEDIAALENALKAFEGGVVVGGGIDRTMWRFQAATSGFHGIATPDRISRLLAALKERAEWKKYAETCEEAAEAAEARLARAVELLKKAPMPLAASQQQWVDEATAFLKEQAE